MPYCPKCGRAINNNASFCPNCGTAITPQRTIPSASQPLPHTNTLKPVTDMKSGRLAAVLSLIFLGLGQLYVKRIKRGIAIFIGGVILFVFTSPLVFVSPTFFFMPLFFYWIWNISDAYRLAKKHNQEVTRRLPQSIVVPVFQASPPSETRVMKVKHALEKLEALRLQGKVSSRAYQDLKGQYETELKNLELNVEKTK